MLKKFGVHFGSVAPCLLAIIVDSLGFGLIYPIFTAMLTSPSSGILSPEVSIGIRQLILSLGYLLFPLSMLFGASFMGDLSDVYGRKKILILCLFGLFISFLLMGIAIMIPSITLLLFGRALSGIVAGSQPIAQAVIADKTTKESKAHGMGLVTLTISIGIVLGPSLGGILSDRELLPFFHYYTPMFVSAAIALVALIWMYFGFEESFLKPSHKRVSLMRPITIFIDAFRDKSVRTLSCIFTFMQVGFSIFYAIILVLWKIEYNYPSWELGVFTGFIGLSFIPAISFILPWLLKKTRGRIEGIAFWSLLITGICEVVLPALKSQVLIWLLTIPLSGADVIAYTTMLALYSNNVDEASQGWAMGVSGAVVAFSWAVGGLFANLIDLIGARLIIFIGGIFMLISAILMIRFKMHVERLRLPTGE